MHCNKFLSKTVAKTIITQVKAMAGRKTLDREVSLPVGMSSVISGSYSLIVCS